MNRRNFIQSCLFGVLEIYPKSNPVFAIAGISEKEKIDVYFTIDDGPRNYMSKILSILGKNNPSTFF